MEDLYDNLENYHDEKLIDELKNENIDLKIKLEEYSSAMIRLQNDFDKLNSDYKKLEFNYSSLLKTARAEIERKSHMIKSLNLEKDLLVIKTLQNSGKNILKNRRPNVNDIQESNKSHTVLEPTLDCQNKGKTHMNERVNRTHAQSEDITSSLENKSNYSEDKESKNNITYHNTRNKDRTKENITKETQCSQSKGQKISDRRKSMLLNSRIEPIFSSDDDFEALGAQKRRKSPLKGDTRQSERISERNDRDTYYSSSKDMYKNNSDYGIDHDKYRRKKYESGQKYKRRSSERCHSKYIKEDYPEPRQFKSNNGKQRVLRSPPADKYNHSKSKYKWERRFAFENEKYFDNERHSPHNHNYSTVKHKIRNEIDEPISKRQKTETSNKSITKQNISNNNMTELDLIGNIPPHQDFVEPSSCQSPDYDKIDSTIIPLHVVKEIKYSATSPLDDPRVSSKKYSIRHHKEKTVLSTIVSENIDIKPVNVSTWDIPNIKQFTLPEQLRKETDINLMNEVYTDIDKALLNDSLESGEIMSLKDYVVYGNKSNDKNDGGNDILDNLRVTDSNMLQKPVANKYKIPKVKIVDKDIINADIQHDNFETSKKYNSAYNCSKTNNEKGDRENCVKVSTTSCHEALNIEKVKNIEHKDEIIRKREKHRLSEKTVVIGTLADDLELSDEASDSMNMQEHAKKSKRILKKDKTYTTVELHKPPIDLLSYKDENKQNESKEISKSVVSKKVPPKESPRESGKSRKSKKKIEQKESNTEAKEQSKKLQEVPHVGNTILKTVLSTHTTTKFGDLFGDSSSLITPNDLGIAPAEIQHPLAGKYVSIFDNTQDAVDLSVEDVNIPQCVTAKSSTIQGVLGELADDKIVIEKMNSDDVNILDAKDSDKNGTRENASVNNVYGNEKYQMLSDSSDIVKTVIISTGVQPKYMPQNVPSQDGQNVEYLEIANDNKANMAKCVLNNIKALATSTPQKTEHESVSIVLQDSNLLDSNISSEIAEKKEIQSNMSDSSHADKVINEPDVPDVRIFVRRRRKINKKP